MAISEAPLVDAALMAIAEINQTGGVLGQFIYPVIEDAASDPDFFEAKARKLIQCDRVTTIFGCWTSVSRKAVLPVVEKLNALLWYPVQSEGLECSRNIFYTGSCPNQQVEPAVTWLLQHKGKRFYLLGSNYVFPRTANKIIKAQLKQQEGTVVGEEYVPLGETDFTKIISTIKQAQPDVVFNTLNGDSNIAFYHQYRESGITADEIPILAVSVAEAELQRIGKAAVGHYACWSYFQSLDTPRNRQFVENFQQRYGADRVTSDPIEAAYTQVYLWKQAVEHAQSFEVERVRVAAYGQSFEAPGGLVRIEPNHHVGRACRIGQILPSGQFEIIYSHARPINPLPWLGMEQANFNASEVVIEMLAEVSRGLHHTWQLEQKSRELEAAKEQLQREIIQRENVEVVMRDSEAQLHALLAAITDVVLVLDTGGRYLQIAPTNLALLHKPADQLIGKTLHEVFPKAQADTFLAHIQQSLETQQTINVEYSHPTVEKPEVWFAATISPLGKDSVIWVARDITERKRAEEALQESERRYRSVVDNLKECVFQTDASGLWMFLNPAWTEITGFSVEESLGTQFLDYVHPSDRQHSLELFAPLLKQQKEYCRDEVRYLTKDCGFRWIEVYARLTLSPDGKIIGTSGTLNDITERKRAEEARQESEARFRAAAEGSLDAFFIFQNLRDETGRILDFTFADINSKGEQMISMSREEVIGKRMCELLPINRTEGFFEKYVNVVKTGIVLEEEFPISTPQVKASWLHHQVVPLSNGIAITARDITERKRSEEVLRQQKEILQTIFDHIPIMVVFYDAAGQMQLINREVERVLGWPIAQVGTFDLLAECYPAPEYRQKVLDFMRRATGEWQEFQTRTKDGQILDTCWTTIRLSDGTSIGIGQDITERKQIEEARRSAETRYRSIFENTFEGLFQMTPYGRLLSANPGLARIYGYESAEELRASSIYLNRQRYFDKSRWEEFLARMQTQERVSDFESQVYRKDGEVIWISENAHVVCNAEGELLYYEGSVVDITKRKVWEEALRYQQECTEELLLNILPAPIAERLKRAESTIADNFADVTVLFADLVNFTEISSQIPPTRLVDLLNKIFSEFDQLAENHGLEKIKTIGDAYMVVGGLPTTRPDHAEAIAEMALDMQHKITRFKGPNGEPFRLRIGINTGPVIAGVIGTKKFTYDLWGDTVNLASRMESHGVAGRIQVTAATYERLKDKYLFEPRGLTHIKGKGEMITYWLIRREL
jgi:urea transport system substrate-binding protein